MHFKKDWAKIYPLLDSDSKINAIIFAYAVNLDLNILPTNIEAQNIHNPIFEIFKMIPTNFHIDDKLKISWFYQKMFLIANNNIKLILEIHIPDFGKTDI